MLATFQTGVRELELREIPEPALPDDGLILRVQAVGVCGSDLRRWREGLAPGQRPFIPGHEVAGVVEAVGAAVTRYQVGDRLALGPEVHCGHCWYCQRGLYNLCDTVELLGTSAAYPGGFAERMALSGEVLANGIVNPIPDGLPYDLAAMAEPCSSVLASHIKTDTSLNDTVVVIGAGPVGVLLAAVARARGAQAYLVVRSETRRTLAARFEPDGFIDLRTDDMIAKTLELTDGRGADIVLCANPDVDTQNAAVQMARRGGKIVLFGGVPKAQPMTTLDSNLIHYGEREVLGIFSYHRTIHAMALDLYDQGVIPIERLITHRFPLSQVREAFDMANSGQGLKVVVDPTE